MISEPTKSKVQLEVFELNSGKSQYQALAINLLEPKSLIEVSEMLALEIPPELDWQREIILYGGAPNWLYNHLVWRFHNVPWVACFNIQLNGAVVVSSNIAQVQPGDTIPINTNKDPGEAILICGAPDSGKSILSYALRKSLPAIKSDWRIYLHRANWDGEGNHTLENPDPDLAKKLKEKSKFKIHLHPNADQLMPEYFAYHSDAVKNIRQVVDLALVDVGGKAEAVKKAVIEQCTHYIIRK
jgi:CRISPR-associated protein Csx3